VNNCSFYFLYLLHDIPHQPIKSDTLNSPHENESKCKMQHCCSG